MDRLRRIALCAVCVLVPAVARAAEIPLDGQVFTLPDGFEIEVVAKPPIVNRPITGAFDEQGRLYVADSSGSNDKVKKQLAERPHRILRLEDTNGDGKFDRHTVFADKMMFPEGTMWLDGSLYVSAPPSIWKLTDTDGDGVADRRQEWLQAHANQLRQRPARPVCGTGRLDLLVQGGLRRPDVPAPRQEAGSLERRSHLPRAA